MMDPLCNEEYNRNMGIADALLHWFAANKRELPFRQNKTPYTIWLSEIMAQQTQIDTLIPYYLRFIATFPTVADLAKASEEAVLKAWQGLGYYSRARNLHKTAKLVMTAYGGTFPQHQKELLKLPGIGPYTAGAIASIACGEAVAAVDGNVLRVVMRLIGSDSDIARPETKKQVEAWVLREQPENHPGDFNEALMELGALICTPTSPKCLICPLRDTCIARLEGLTDTLPVKSKKAPPKKEKWLVAHIQHRGQTLLVKRPTKGLLANLWGLPMFPEPAEAACRTWLAALLPEGSRSSIELRPLGRVKHVFTHIVWDMTAVAIDLPAIRPLPEGIVLADADALATTFAVPTAFHKILDLGEKSQKIT